MNNVNTINYSVLYNITLNIFASDNEIQISNSDIYSISFIHDYDNATFPIIRIRLYTDLVNMQLLTESANNISVCLNMNAGIYKMNNENKSPELVSGAKNISFSLSGYIENKNIPTSKFDQFKNGIKNKKDLNVNNKVPITIFCYNAQATHFTLLKLPSVYKNMTLTSVLQSILSTQGYMKYQIDNLDNQERFDYILIPNMNFNQALAYFDSNYGLYRKGGQAYGDIDKFYITNSNTDNISDTIPIYVNSYDNNANNGGMMKIDNKYYMNINANNISVLSSTDIERIINSKDVTSINIHDITSHTSSMDLLYDSNYQTSVNDSLEKIKNMGGTQDILHKSKNKFVNDTYIARVTEKITEVQVSCTGFDIGLMKINSRYNLIFESPIRSTHLNKKFRASRIVHTLSNISSDLFSAQTTMTLCNN